MSVTEYRWLLLVFRLPTRRASLRVQVWRQLRRAGALPLHNSGYLLPDTPAHRERFEWLAALVRRSRGAASVVQAQSVDDLPGETLARRFLDARARDYAVLLRELGKAVGSKGAPARLTRLRRRLQEIVAIDFFGSPLRKRAEALLERAEAGGLQLAGSSEGTQRKRDYRHRTWLTRPRPGIDRVSSAWLIRRYIDPRPRFVFADRPEKHAGAVPFDVFGAGGFGHRGEDCTFETLRKEFRITDPRVRIIGEIVHDADLGDEKFARREGYGLDRVLVGWAQQGVADDELLRRGMQLIDALCRALA